MPSILTEKEKARSCSFFFMVWVNDLNPIKKKKKVRKQQSLAVVDGVGVFGSPELL